MKLKTRRAQRLAVSVVVAVLVLVSMAATSAVDEADNAATAPTPADNPTTTTVAPPSGEAMPSTDLPGWKLRLTDDFNADAALGDFPGDAYDDEWQVYPDGTPDTAGQNEDGNGRYYPSKVVSVTDGVLNKFVHTDDGIAMGAALIPRRSYDMTYGRYSVRFRADAVKGYKVAWLLWPDSERWPDDGEIDYPEGTLDEEFYAASIYAQPWDGQHRSDKFPTGVTMRDWHTATTEWVPGEVRFFLDGRLIGRSTHKTPNKPMHWVLQTETCVPDCLPTKSARGNVQIDWVAMWERQP